MKRVVNIIVNAVLIVSLLLPFNVVNGMVTVAAANYQTLSESSGLFRTEVDIRQEYDLTRLKEMGLLILSENEDSAVVLVSSSQLETLTRLGFRPRASEDLNILVSANAVTDPWLSLGLQADLNRATASFQTAGNSINQAEDVEKELVEIIARFSIDQQNGILALPGVDSDADGLTDTQQSWWCTDPMNPDSDGDGKTDGAEILAIKNWMGNRSVQAPGETPWPTWPFDSNACPDKDFDSVPNLVEKYELGLNMDLESTDHDKFDDGQEVFGITYCPGGDYSCGYGDLPRSSDAGYVGQIMPAWVRYPGSHPFVAAFPSPEVEVVNSSIKVETVTEVTTDHVISNGSERNYTTSETNGTSSSVTETVTWNEWQEFAESYQELILQKNVNLEYEILNMKPGTEKIWTGALQIVSSGLGIAAGCVGSLGLACVLSVAAGSIPIAQGIAQISEGRADNIQAETKANTYKDTKQIACFPNEHDDSNDPCRTSQGQTTVVNQAVDQDNILKAIQGTQYAYLQAGQAISQRLYEISNILSAPKLTQTNSQGESRGGEQSNSTSEYQELSISNGEAFSSEESWGNATAINSAHTADLWFSYSISNYGTEYAKEVGNLAFNIYLNDDPNPVTTYFVGPDLGGDGAFHNFMPGETHTFTSQRVPLSLEQLRMIDLGGVIRIELEDLSYGADELYYQNAINSNIEIAIEDGTHDGDEDLDRYLIPVYQGDTVTDVIHRFFPTTSDGLGRITALWSPEYRQDTPDWCDEPIVVGLGANRTLWCKHAVSVMDWWNVYLNDMGDGSSDLNETQAVSGGTVLIRINSDSDLDGYSDRSELRFGTDILDVNSYPAPELIAGLHSITTENNVVSTLSFLNTGLSDAYGVEAIMVAPDDSITITNNTVGGSGRVKALSEIVVGSRMLPITLTEVDWAGTATPLRSGYYNGIVDKKFTFSIDCSYPAGCEVGTDQFSVSWSDTINTGLVEFSDAYQSPSVIDIGVEGIELSFLSGKVYSGDQFSFDVYAPRDTFKYTINSYPYTPPIIIVSYNDPQGNHRFILPEDAMSMESPTTDLMDFSGMMIPMSGVEIISRQEFQTGVNPVHFLLDNPTQSAIQAGKLHMWVVSNDGTIVLKQSSVATQLPGPNIIDLSINTDSFVPAYNPQNSYIVLAHWTDYADNILDETGRHLSNFQTDSTAYITSNMHSLVWDFGSVQKGQVIEEELVFANTGTRNLSLWIDTGAPYPVMQESTLQVIGQGEMHTFILTLDTATIPAGQYDGSLLIRTNDINNPIVNLQIVGSIFEPSSPVTPLTNSLLPLEEILFVHGPIEKNTKVNYLTSNKLVSNTVPMLFSDTAAVIKGKGEDFISLPSNAFDGEGTQSPALTDGMIQDQIDLTGATELEEYRTEASRTYVWPDGRGVILMANKVAGENSPNDQTQVGVRYDAYVNSYHPNISTWNQKLVYLGNVPIDKKTDARILIWFDLPTLPQYAVLDSAYVDLYSHSWYGSNTINTQVFRITGNWTQGDYEPTWNNHPPVDWGTVWSSTDLAKNTGYKTWNVTNLVGAWYGGTPNYGMAIRANPQNSNGFSFRAHEYLSNVPVLSINFHIPPPPAAPSLYAISNADADGSYSVDWSDVANTTHYELQENLNGGAFGTLYSGAASIYNATGRGVGYRCYRVRAVNAYGASGYSGQQCTTINPAPGIPVLSPIDNSDGDGSYTISWTSVNYATSYDLRENHNSGTYNTIYSGANRNFAATSRAVGQWCYMVRAINASGTGTWSVPQCVVVNLPPNPPLSLSPANGAHILGRSINFSWENGGDNDGYPGTPIQYKVEITPVTGGAPIESPVLDATQWIGIVPADGEYLWRVKAYDGSSWGEWSVQHNLGVYSIARTDATHTQIAIPENVDDYTHYRVSYGINAGFTAANVPQLLELQLPKRIYTSVTLDILLKSAVPGNVNFTIDIGNDGSTEWSQALTWTEPASFESPNLAQVINAYMLQSPQSGGEIVTFPVLVNLSTPGDLYLYNLVGLVGVDSDPMIGAGDISFGNSNPIETENLTINAKVHNAGIFTARNTMANFYVGNPDAGGKYIGSKLIPNIPGNSFVNASIQWNTSGYTGEQSIYVILDKADQVDEIDETNNSTSVETYILTRPDLFSDNISLSDLEPMLNETVTMSISLSNEGEADSAESLVMVYDGEKSQGGSLVGEGASEVIGKSSTQLMFSWTPQTMGLHRLYVYSDINDQINEYDESNNLSWMDVYVGVAGPLRLDSGAAADPMYLPEIGHGYIDINQPDEIVNCGTQPEHSLRRDPDGEVVYQFDHLLPGHFYHLDITLYECDGAGRQESIFVDDNLIAGPTDLGDGQVHRLSLRIDPALYADREMKVSIKADGIDGAVVSEVNLFDIDYRYADAGGGNDPQYPGKNGYGWLDGSAVTTWGTLPYQSVRVDQTDAELRYRFDELDPNKRYNVHMTFWQPSGTGRIMKVQVDGIDTKLVINNGDYLKHQESITIPLAAYSSDGSAVVSIIRTNASTGAMVNEIALEEETISTSSGCTVQETPYFTETYGEVLIETLNAPIGSIVEAISPRGNTVGCFTVHTEGDYGFMRIYGEDTTADPAIPGMREGEIVIYKVNGAPAVATPTIYWEDDRASHLVNLNAGATSGHSILLQAGWNLISFNVEPTTASVPLVLQSISGRYDRVLGEGGVYVPTLPDNFNTLREMHSTNGYYIRVNGTTSVTALIEGMQQPCDNPKALHAGWNWIGGPCQPTPTAVALASIEGHYQRVLSLNKTYDPALPAYSTLLNLIPGEGYLIFITEPVSLVYPIGTQKVIDEPIITSQVCRTVQPTPYTTTIYGEIEWIGLPTPKGSVVEILTPRGEVAGCALTGEGGILPITHIYGADEDGISGFVEGEPMAFRVNGLESLAEPDIFWHDDWGIQRVRLTVSSSQVYIPMMFK